MSSHRPLPRASRLNLYFYHHDHLGSPRVITDAAGEKIASYEYLPFGYKKSGPRAVSPFAFTGKPRDSESNLQYFGARYYGQFSRRFLTCDPQVKPDITLMIKHRILNFYVFENDNPVNYIDPDGELAFLVAIAIAAGVGVAIDYFSQYVEAHKKTDISLYKYWISGEYPVEREAIVGGFSAITGVIGFGITSIPSAAAPLYVKMGAGAVAVSLIDKAKSQVLGEDLTTEEAVVSGLAGSVSTAISGPLTSVSGRIVSQNTKATFEAVSKVIGNEEVHKIYLRPVIKAVRERLEKLPKNPKINPGFHHPYEIKWTKMDLPEPAY